MPGILNEDDLSALAAEYVIGTLDPDERARANALLDLDEGFRALVRAWERRLGELHLMVEPVEPDGQIWDRIRDRLGVRAPAPPPFAPQLAATPTLAAAPISAPISAPLSASAFSASIAPSALEPSLESKPELAPQAPSPLSPPPLSPPPFSLPQSFSPPPSPPPFPQPGQRTPEQELASLIAEADKFTTQLTELAGGQAKAEQGPAPTEPSDEAALHAESLLTEAADAIAAKPVEPHEAEHAEEELWPEQSDAIQDLPPPIRATGPRNDGTMLLSPTDVARITVQRQQRRIGRWRAATLLMTFLVLGLGSLIAAWRFAPDRLPQQLQPIAVLGLGEWSPSERIPAEHGTQFEE
jgi:hypothetical protein